MLIPGAKYEYVPRMDDGARDTRWNAVVLHTNGSKTPVNGDLFNWWSTGANPGVGAHLQVAWEQPGKTDDFTYQYLNTDRFTGHAWDANHWTVGVETEDGGDPTQPWTEQQIGSIIAICKALFVPGRLLKETPSSGVGYHQQFASWNKSNHDCPGKVRVAQIMDVIIPALNAKEDDVALNTSECAAIAYLWGQKERVEDTAPPKNRPTKYTGSDGVNHVTAAQHGYDDKDAEIAARAAP